MRAERLGKLARRLIRPQPTSLSLSLALVAPVPAAPLCRSFALGKLPVSVRRASVLMSRRIPIDERFWNKTDRAEDGCWVWTGCLNSKGYGLVWLDGKAMLAHRVAYQLAVGPVSEHCFVCHKCDNRRCIRPDHLFLGSHLANMRDMREKGRAARGERNVHAKLTERQVTEIRT